MKFNEIFTASNTPSQSIGGLTPFLNREDCQVETKIKNENAVMLVMKRASDGEEGHVYIRVKEEFLDLSQALLTYAFNSSELIGLTLTQLDDLELPINIESLNGRLSLKS